MRTVMIRGAAFAAGFIAAGAALWLIGFAGRSAAGYSSDGWLGNAAMAAWLVTSQAVINAIAFSAVTAASRRLRQRARPGVALVGALAGAVAYAMSWVGLATALGPIRAVLGPVLAVWIGFALPGLAVGVIALAWAIATTSTLGRQSG